MLLWNERITSWCDCVVVALCVVTSIFSYTKIFLTLRHNQIHAQGNVNQGQPSQTVQLNTARYKRTVSSVLWVQVALVVCYLPVAIVEFLRIQRGVTLDIVVARFYSTALGLLYSSFNHILYCWKIREVRQAVKDTLSGLLCSSSQFSQKYVTIFQHVHACVKAWEKPKRKYPCFLDWILRVLYNSSSTRLKSL